ncbi:MAG: gliding motility-associated C-terminal domain-containing protein [Sporocytophaga sp.]|uniref:T9SS type B sorting domain-containing protein n=1 Tax=Sporocytophaga sp. TaxID=2231183 RepID=UPI001B101087|nr:gliding motility-associated C-terminal domain-containing protein [Sporocytophaga sp.]MBO9701417.1 gliding motility-associated C-terminal domain-containing protein [Sporocytophaga sp.]
MHKSSFLTLFYFLIVFYSIAQPATIDSSFNKAGSPPGIFQTRFYGKEEEARMIIAQPDEKVVMVGASLNGSKGHDFTFVRIKPDGTLDESFASKGKGIFSVSDTTDDYPEAVAIDKAGRILIGGYFKASGTTLPVIIRLTQDGNIDKTFGKEGKLFPDLTTKKKMTSIHSLKRQGDKILAVGSYVDSIYLYINGPTTVVFRLNDDGTIDRTFGSKGITILDDVACYQIALNETSIALGGSYPMPLKTESVTNPIVAMLKSDGTINTTFGDKGFYQRTVVAEEMIADMAFQKDGKLVTVGQVRDQSVIMRLNSNGKIDSTFATAGRLVNLIALKEKGKSIFVLPNGKILATIEAEYSDGNFTSQRLRLVKLSEKGEIESFGYDQISNFSTSLNNSVLTSDYNLICARATGYDFSVVKVKTKIMPSIRFLDLPKLNIASANTPLVAYASFNLPVLFKSSDVNVAETKDTLLIITGAGPVTITAYVEASIDYEVAKANQAIIVSPAAEFLVGKNYTSTKKVQTYAVIPYNGEYSYEWSYSGENAYLLNNNQISDSTNKVNIYFSDDAVEGTLTCRIYDKQGLVKAILRKEIKVVEDATDGNIRENVCPKSFALCYATHINSFRINTLKSDSSGCQGTGYTDFTESGRTTDLFLGNVYTADFEISAIGKSSKYVGIWIDYNNDGDFDEADEFVNATFGEDSLVSMKPIIIKNSKEYAGSRRLRVRCRTNGRFTSSDACILSGEAGETEDYMVTLKVEDALEAPEIITPNEDGKNDYFVIRGVNDKADNRLDIFDKWGDIKYSCANYLNNWNGKTNTGAQVTEGTYYYVFKNGANVLKGFVEVKY